MESIKQVFVNMADTHPIISQLIQPPQQSDLFSATQTLPTAIQEAIVKQPTKIKLLEYSLSVYCPEEYSHHTQEILIPYMTDIFKGVTCSSGKLGIWENPDGVAIIEPITIAKSCANSETISKHLEGFFKHIFYWGRLCQQQEIALEVGGIYGSLMLLIPMN